jgi:hypothetical protein
MLFLTRKSVHATFIFTLQKCGFWLSWKGILFAAATASGAAKHTTPSASTAPAIMPTPSPDSIMSLDQLTSFWRRMEAQNHDESSQFMFVLTRGNPHRRYLVPEDFVPLIQDVVDTHPGLGFLKEATEFHSRYVHTVSLEKNSSWVDK